MKLENQTTNQRLVEFEQNDIQLDLVDLSPDELQVNPKTNQKIEGYSSMIIQKRHDFNQI